jgi:SAM-dependent methyltransferase
VNTTFGEVASLYDAVRPDLPREIAGLVLSYVVSQPSSAAEIGAGTGKATALFAGRGFPITCIEPDPRMSSRLHHRLPDADVTVVTSSFEDWQPPADGVDLLYASLAWHWLDPQTRAPLAVRALARHGTLAVIGRKTVIVEEALGSAVEAVFDRFPGRMPSRPPLPDYAIPELQAQPEITDVRTWTLSQSIDYRTDAFLALQQTFSPFRFRTPEIREAIVEGVRAAIDDAGGVARTRLDTYVVLAHRR